MIARVDGIRTLLKGIESGDPEAVSVLSPTQYIQHNPQTHSLGKGWRTSSLACRNPHRA